MIHNMSDDECMQFYQQPLMDGIMVLDPSSIMDGTMSSSEGTMSPSNSHNSSHNQLTPKSGAIFKPIRRRSRVSKKTPTTLLKANTSNFRALVQQFTGNPTTAAAMSLSIHKGPITLNFKQNKLQNTHYHTKITRPMPPFGTISSTPMPQQAEQVPMPQQQSGYWLEHGIKSGNFVPTSGNSYSCMDDGFLFDNNDFSDVHGLFM